MENNVVKNKLVDSFLENDLTPKERNAFFKVFDFIAEKIKDLSIIESKVTINRTDNTVNVLVTLPKNITIEIIKATQTIDEDEVLYTIDSPKQIYHGQGHIDDMISKLAFY